MPPFSGSFVSGSAKIKSLVGLNEQIVSQANNMKEKTPNYKQNKRAHFEQRAGSVEEIGVANVDFFYIFLLIRASSLERCLVCIKIKMICLTETFETLICSIFS